MPRLRIVNNSPEFAELISQRDGAIVSVPPKRRKKTNLSLNQYHQVYQSLRDLIDNPLVEVNIEQTFAGEPPITLPGSVQPGDRILHEELEPEPDGTVKTFEVSNDPIDGTVRVYVNMLEQSSSGDLNSYSRNGKEITFEQPPPDDHYLTATYRTYSSQ